jgi:hypothetical protein
LKAAELARKQQIEKETRERRQNRANMKEQIRLENLEDIIVNQVIKPAPTGEWNPKISVQDLRDINRTDNTCFYTFGGLLGEIILTLSTVNDYILAQPQQFSGLNFFDIEHYLTVLMNNDFPLNAVKLDLVSNPRAMTADDLCAFAMEPKNIASFGLRFLLEMRNRINLGGVRAANDVVKAVANITLK